MCSLYKSSEKVGQLLTASVFVTAKKLVCAAARGTGHESAVIMVSYGGRVRGVPLLLPHERSHGGNSGSFGGPVIITF
ncbi:hypothetical protein F2P81_025635 [Scophthalmus maximus]|uniref:Uncharacterized protein n=1 Tax=Scophthalmus maximus TaxID=52904 RepID=A0A6A4RSX1_SCOMX|nr:hypothetical protein F2P81_025635 [Scophthalmus maximus]